MPILPSDEVERIYMMLTSMVATAAGAVATVPAETWASCALQYARAGEVATDPEEAHACKAMARLFAAAGELVAATDAARDKGTVVLGQGGDA